MARVDPKNGSTIDWLTDKALRALLGYALRLPYERRVPWMGRIMSETLGPLAGYRKRAESNLHLIYPDMPKDRKSGIAREVCDNFGRTLIENYSHAELGKRLQNVDLSGAGLGPLSDAQHVGRPVIFVTGHFGNHEVPRHALTHAGFTVGGLYRPMGNPFFNDHYKQTMTSWVGPVFEQGRRGTMGFARHLKNGGMGTLLFDVNAKGGRPVQFLGHDAMTATSAAELAARFDALVIPYFATRNPDGLTFDIEIESPIKPDSPVTMMREMTKRLEARIERHPGQWFWVHRRWKSRPTVSPSGSLRQELDHLNLPE